MRDRTMGMQNSEFRMFAEPHNPKSKIQNPKSKIQNYPHQSLKLRSCTSTKIPIFLRHSAEGRGQKGINESIIEE
jgi:hypothetical protein